jgi:hypothetical protein
MNNLKKRISALEERSKRSESYCYMRIICGGIVVDGPTDEEVEALNNAGVQVTLIDIVAPTEEERREAYRRL